MQRFEFDKLEQYGRRDTIPDNGIPETEGEDTNEIVRALAVDIGDDRLHQFQQITSVSVIECLVDQVHHSNNCDIKLKSTTTGTPRSRQPNHGTKTTTKSRSSDDVSEDREVNWLCLLSIC